MQDDEMEEGDDATDEEENREADPEEDEEENENKEAVEGEGNDDEGEPSQRTRGRLSQKIADRERKGANKKYEVTPKFKLDVDYLPNLYNESVPLIYRYGYTWYRFMANKEMTR